MEQIAGFSSEGTAADVEGRYGRSACSAPAGDLERSSEGSAGHIHHRRGGIAGFPGVVLYIDGSVTAYKSTATDIDGAAGGEDEGSSMAAVRAAVHVNDTVVAHRYGGTDPGMLGVQFGLLKFTVADGHGAPRVILLQAAADVRAHGATFHRERLGADELDAQAVSHPVIQDKVVEDDVGVAVFEAERAVDVVLDNLFLDICV